MRAAAFLAALILALGCCHADAPPAPPRMAARVVGESRDVTRSYVSGGLPKTGADPTGTADSAPALNYWLALPGESVVPCGTYRIKSTVTIGAGAKAMGAGRGCVTVKIDDSSGNIGDGLKINDVYGAEIHDLTVSAYSARTAGNGVHVVGGDPTKHLQEYSLSEAGALIEDVDSEYQYNAIVIENDEALDYRVWRVNVQRGMHRHISNSGTGIWINTCLGTPSPARFGGDTDVTDTYFISDTSATPLAAVRVTGTGGSHLTRVRIFGPQYGLLIDPPVNGMVTSLIIDGGFYDRASIASVRIAPSGIPFYFGAIQFNGVWMAGASTNVLQIVGTTVKDVRFSNCDIYTGQSGYVGVINGASGVQFNGGSVSGSATGGLNFTGNASDFSVHGVRFWRGIGTGGPDAALPIGVNIDSGSDSYDVSGNNFKDCTTPIVNTPGASSNRRIVAPNVED